MRDILGAAGSDNGLIWLLLSVIVAGLVRGFAGFGSALIIMPVASSVLTPVQAVIFLTAADMLGRLPNLRAALRQGTPRDVGLLLVGVVLALPIGLICLGYVAPGPFGWIVSGVVLTLLVLLLAGWRYQGALGTRLITGTGALGGFMNGFLGIAGPPVIMLYMASTLPVGVIRANFLLYLVGIDALLLAMLWGFDMLVWDVFALGLLMGIPNILANMLGARLFTPGSEPLFRTVAYIVIAASAIVGLPLWKG